eukprot:scaffold64749_cov28-Tisochrysis_lutea.AAC.4
MQHVRHVRTPEPGAVGGSAEWFASGDTLNVNAYFAACDIMRAAALTLLPWSVYSARSSDPASPQYIRPEMGPQGSPRVRARSASRAWSLCRRRRRPQILVNRMRGGNGHPCRPRSCARGRRGAPLPSAGRREGRPRIAGWGKEGCGREFAMWDQCSRSRNAARQAH